MQVDVHPHAYPGKVQGFSSVAGIVPTFIVDPRV
jgi:hypothetical protein